MSELTRDVIINMPAGREMDALVAEKVMEWDHNHKINECEDGRYSYCIYCGYGPRFEEVEPGGCYTPPRYSTNIAAAWEVVEKMQAMDLEVDYPGMWYVSIQPPGERWSMTVAALTAPLAICRAALLTTI